LRGGEVSFVCNIIIMVFFIKMKIDSY